MKILVTVPVDFQYLEWSGWDAFCILDAGIRKGVLMADQLSRFGDYQEAELEAVFLDRWPITTGRLHFVVESM